MLKITTNHFIIFFQYSCSEYGDASSAVIEEQFEVNVTGSRTICKRQYNEKILQLPPPPLPAYARYGTKSLQHYYSRVTNFILAICLCAVICYFTGEALSSYT